MVVAGVDRKGLKQTHMQIKREIFVEKFFHVFFFGMGGQFYFFYI